MLIRTLRRICCPHIIKQCLSKTLATTVDSLPELKAVLSSKITQEIEKVKEFRKKYNKHKVSEVTVDTVYGGLRGCVCLWCDTSHLDPMEGIRFRGYSIPELQKLLPKTDGGKQPLPEGLFWLMLTGDIPSKAQVDSVSQLWASRAELPPHVEHTLDSLPHSVHPMTQFSAAITLLNSESSFTNNLPKIRKTMYWEYMYEDTMFLIPKLTTIAAKIYLNTFKKGHDRKIKASPDKDWACNFAEMIGFPGEFAEVMRLYLTLHADHEGGNVSAHAVHLIGSALSDAYLSLAGGMNGLAGPLHGLANQQCLAFIMNIKNAIGVAPTDDALKEFIVNFMKSGHVIPGFGHAVLRKTDPRYTCFKEYSEQNIPHDPLIKLLHQVVKIAVPVLQATGKVKNPYPNVDCHSGTILHYYGMTEPEFYTVLFGVSRSMGVLSSLIWHRALGIPIERPNSITTQGLVQLVSGKK